MGLTPLAVNGELSIMKVFQMRFMCCIHGHTVSHLVCCYSPSTRDAKDPVTKGVKEKCTIWENQLQGTLKRTTGAQFAYIHIFYYIQVRILRYYGIQVLCNLIYNLRPLLRYDDRQMNTKKENHKKLPQKLSCMYRLHRYFLGKSIYFFFFFVRYY